MSSAAWPRLRNRSGYWFSRRRRGLRRNFSPRTVIFYLREPPHEKDREANQINKERSMTNTNGAQRQQVWFALADARSCRLFCRTMTVQGTPYSQEYDSLENALPEQEHSRPTT